MHDPEVLRRQLDGIAGALAKVQPPTIRLPLQPNRQTRRAQARADRRRKATL